MESKVINPLFFTSDICPNCGEESITLKDQYGHITSNPIYTAVKAVCNKCNREFYIDWKDIDGKKVPVPCKKERRDELEQDIIQFALSNVRKLETIK